MPHREGGSGRRWGETSGDPLANQSTRRKPMVILVMSQFPPPGLPDSVLLEDTDLTCLAQSLSEGRPAGTRNYLLTTK